MVWKTTIHDFLKKAPYFWRLAPRFADKEDAKFVSTHQYWEDRYAAGGTSGSGSAGVLAQFKAKIINDFVQDRRIQTLIEFGCGDGNQLALSHYENYLGLDISISAIRQCIGKFSADKTKKFCLYDPECFLDNGDDFVANASLSLDVIYHLIEDDVFKSYMEHLFRSAEFYVIIYSSNFERAVSARHVMHRKFTPYIAEHFPDWKLLKQIKNPHPAKSDEDKFGSFSEFYIYERQRPK